MSQHFKYVEVDSFDDISIDKLTHYIFNSDDDVYRYIKSLINDNLCVEVEQLLDSIDYDKFINLSIDANKIKIYKLKNATNNTVASTYMLIILQS